MKYKVKLNEGHLNALITVFAIAAKAVENGVFPKKNGKPLSKKQGKKAVLKAFNALNPAFDARKSQIHTEVHCVSMEGMDQLPPEVLAVLKAAIESQQQSDDIEPAKEEEHTDQDA